MNLSFKWRTKEWTVSEQMCYWISSKRRDWDHKMQTYRRARWYLKPGVSIQEEAAPHSTSQSVMLLTHTYTNHDPFMQFHKDEIHLQWRNPETILRWHASHCPCLWVCVHCHPTFRRPGQCHPQRPLTGRWQQVSHDEPKDTHWMIHDLGASSPWEGKEKPTCNALFKMPFML